MALSWDLRVQSSWRKDCGFIWFKSTSVWAVMLESAGHWDSQRSDILTKVFCNLHRFLSRREPHMLHKHNRGSFNVSRAGQRYLWLLWMHFISFEESVLFWIDTALRSHPPFQLPQRAFHPRRLFRAPPLCTLQLQKAKPLWPTIPSLPFHLSQPQQCTTQAPQHPPSPHGHTLNLWIQLPHLQVEPLLGRCTRRSSL